MLQRIRYGIELSGTAGLQKTLSRQTKPTLAARKEQARQQTTRGTQGRGSQYTKAPVVGLLERRRPPPHNHPING